MTVGEVNMRVVVVTDSTGGTQTGAPSACALCGVTAGALDGLTTCTLYGITTYTLVLPHTHCMVLPHTLQCV